MDAAVHCQRDTVVWLTRNELLEENTSRALFCYYCDYGFVLLLEEEEENDDEEDEDEDEETEEENQIHICVPRAPGSQPCGSSWTLEACTS